MLASFDALLYQIEKVAVWVILLGMGMVMFLAVSHRAAGAMSNTHSAPTFLLELVGESGWPWLAPVLVAAVLSAVCGAALATRGSKSALVGGIGLGVGLTALGKLFGVVMPNGIVQAQPMALSLLLWLSLLGASLAAHDRRHLSLDIGSKIWPEALRPKVAAVGHFLSAIFCVVLLVLALRSVQDHFHTWSTSEGAAGVISRTAIPKWFASAAIPYGTFALAFRFFLEAWRTWRGELKEDGDDTLRQLGIQTEEGS